MDNEQVIRSELDGRFTTAHGSIAGKSYVESTVWDLDALAEIAEASGGRQVKKDDAWAGGTWEDALNHCRYGWDDALPATLEIAESAVKHVETIFVMPKFTPTWDLTGAEVDVARYLTGVPENMIDYPMIETPHAGRVITLCASCSISAGFEPDEIIKRGQAIVALTMALSQIGMSIEIWADMTIHGYAKDGKGPTYGRIRTLVKGANDSLDPSRILFGLASPAMLRKMYFAVEDGWTDQDKTNMGVPGSRGMPLDPIQDMAEGTIYLPCLKLSRDKSDPNRMLEDWLKQLGIISDDARL